MARTVARYVRLFVDSEAPNAPATLHAQVRNLEADLGLSPKAMRLLQWVIEPDDVSAGQSVVPTGTEGRRLKAVD